jgi:16S rRNA (cytosine967-C5)-methyltransferase
MIEGASLDLRVNTHLASMQKVMDYLKADGVEANPLPYSPVGLRVRGKTFLSKTKAFAKGWIDIQDEGSQCIALLCATKAGHQVLDYCAGAGGKTLALANRMTLNGQVKGRIVAMDLEEKRLEKGRERFRRAKVSDIIELRPLSEDRHRKWLKRQEQNFDVVLTDVPCSGSGTWRRNPDMRWRVYGPSLAELQALQAEILDKVKHAVKIGGRLIYATCSNLPEENEEQIENFLKNNGHFKIVPIETLWPEEAQAPCQGPYMRMTPLRHKTDGFFACALERLS